MNNDDNWRMANFRANIIAKIEEAKQQSVISTNRSSVEMENHVYNKARTKEEYLGYVARIILHLRNSKLESPQLPSFVIKHRHDADFTAKL